MDKCNVGLFTGDWGRTCPSLGRTSDVQQQHRCGWAKDAPRIQPLLANNKPASRLKVTVSSLSNVKEMMKG